MHREPDAPQEQWHYQHAFGMLLKSGRGTVSINPIQGGPQTTASGTVFVAFFFF